MNKPKATARSAVALSGRFLLAALLAAALPLAACSQEADQEVGDDPYFSISELNRIPIDLPEGIEVSSMERTSSGKIWLLGEYQEKTKDRQPILWELDEDNSWKELADFDELLLLGEDEGVCSSPVILESNKVLCSVARMDGSMSEIGLYLIDFELEDGFRKIEIDTKEFLGMYAFTQTLSGGSTFHIFYPLSDNKVLIEVMSAQESEPYPSLEALLVLDVGNDTLTPLPKPKGYYSNLFYFAAGYDGAVYVMDFQDSSNPALGVTYGNTVNIRTFDLSAGVLSDLDAEKHKELVELIESHREVTPGANPGSLYPNHNPDALIIQLEDGLFEYSNDGVRKLLSSEDVTSLYMDRYFFDDEDSFFLFRRDVSGPLLYRYEKTPSAPETSGALRIWALEESPTLRQAVSLFSDKNPDAEIKLEIGLDREGAIAEDAIKALNVELLAGEGPDVLILDGLPIDSYLERGQFHDLGDIYTEAQSSGLYYDNIIGAFASDSEIKVIPTRYTFPLVIADSSILSRLDSRSALVDLADEIAQDNPESKIFCNMAIFDDVFIASYLELFDQGGFSEEALRQFFDDCDALSEALKPTSSQRSIEPSPYIAVHGSAEDDGFDNSGYGTFQVLREDPNQIMIFEAHQETGFMVNEILLQNAETDLACEALAFNQNHSFIPRVSVAVNANSKEIELSEAFVRMLLSEDTQRIQHADGLSVLSSVFRNASRQGQTADFEDGGTWVSEPLSEEALAAYQSMFASLDAPVAVDKVVQAAVYEELQRFLDGEISKDEALDSCIKRIDLYLAE